MDRLPADPDERRVTLLRLFYDLYKRPPTGTEREFLLCVNGPSCGHGACGWCFWHGRPAVACDCAKIPRTLVASLQERDIQSYLSKRWLTEEERRAREERDNVLDDDPSAPGGPAEAPEQRRLNAPRISRGVRIQDLPLIPTSTRFETFAAGVDMANMTSPTLYITPTAAPTDPEEVWNQPARHVTAVSTLPQREAPSVNQRSFRYWGGRWEELTTGEREQAALRHETQITETPGGEQPEPQVVQPLPEGATEGAEPPGEGGNPPTGPDPRTTR